MAKAIVAYRTEYTNYMEPVVVPTTDKSEITDIMRLVDKWAARDGESVENNSIVIWMESDAKLPALIQTLFAQWRATDAFTAAEDS